MLIEVVYAASIDTTTDDLSDLEWQFHGSTSRVISAVAELLVTDLQSSTKSEHSAFLDIITTYCLMV